MQQLFKLTRAEICTAVENYVRAIHHGVLLEGFSFEFNNEIDEESVTVTADIKVKERKPREKRPSGNVQPAQ